jgi:hypothetical protein
MRRWGYSMMMKRRQKQLKKVLVLVVNLQKTTKATKEGVGTSGQPSELHDGCDDDDDLGYMDHLTYEEASLCDWKNPVMMLQSRYKDMCTF